MSREQKNNWIDSYRQTVHGFDLPITKVVSEAVAEQLTILTPQSVSLPQTIVEIGSGESPFAPTVLKNLDVKKLILSDFGYVHSHVLSRALTRVLSAFPNVDLDKLPTIPKREISTPKDYNPNSAIYYGHIQYKEFTPEQTEQFTEFSNVAKQTILNQGLMTEIDTQGFPELVLPIEPFVLILVSVVNYMNAEDVVRLLADQNLQMLIYINGISNNVNQNHAAFKSSLEPVRQAMVHGLKVVELVTKEPIFYQFVGREQASLLSTNTFAPEIGVLAIKPSSEVSLVPRGQHITSGLRDNVSAVFNPESFLHDITEWTVEIPQQVEAMGEQYRLEYFLPGLFNDDFNISETTANIDLRHIVDGKTKDNILKILAIPGIRSIRYSGGVFCVQLTEHHYALCLDLCCEQLSELVGSFLEKKIKLKTHSNHRTLSDPFLVRRDIYDSIEEINPKNGYIFVRINNINWSHVNIATYHPLVSSEFIGKLWVELTKLNDYDLDPGLIDILKTLHDGGLFTGVSLTKYELELANNKVHSLESIKENLDVFFDLLKKYLGLENPTYIESVNSF